MQSYIGCKQIKAEPMTLGAYNQHRGWEIPADENPERAGYLVVYPDGYISWSPKEIFEAAYLPMGDDPTRITEDMVNDFMTLQGVHTMPDGKTTVVQVELRNGFMITESSSCVDPANYNEGIGSSICLDRARKQVWHLLGFLLQTARHGITTLPTAKKAPPSLDHSTQRELKN